MLCLLYVPSWVGSHCVENVFFLVEIPRILLVKCSWDRDEGV